MALLVNLVLSPLWAIGLCRLTPLQPAHAVGPLLPSGAAGSPFLPKLAEVSGSSLSHSIAPMVRPMVGTIVFMPPALPLIVPGLQADRWTMAKPLPLLMVIPLAIGFALALVVAGTSFSDPAVTVMLLLASVIGLVLLLVLASIMRARATA